MRNVLDKGTENKKAHLKLKKSPQNLAVYEVM
jgi:hypothetical protein